LDAKRTKSRNLAFWTKNEFIILDEIWTKNGQLIAKPNAIRDLGTSKRPPCAKRNRTTMSIMSGACLCGSGMVHATIATCWLQNTKLVQTLKAL